MAKRNFLLGKGERLAEDIVVKAGGGPKEAPYTFSEAKTRLTPKLAKAVKEIDQLPDVACPHDQAVIALTLNPEYIAKSYFPQELLKAAGVEPVGSKPKRITPAKRSRNREPVETLTTELFAIGTRTALRRWKEKLADWTEAFAGGRELVTLEDISAVRVRDKIKGGVQKKGRTTFEVVLHASELLGEGYILHDFRKYLGGLDINAQLSRRFYAGGLCFLELDAPASRAEDIAQYSVVRALREMPRLRMLRPTIRSSSIPTQTLALPQQAALDPDIRVAVFDGGLPKKHPLTAWAVPLDAPSVGSSHKDLLKHGVQVTSALLFGHIEPNHPLPQPYANVDHYRVLDNDPGQNPHELYEVLDRIETVLSANDYDFVNLSLGPRLPIEDDDVHAWTAVLDERFGRTDTLVTVAVGNDGEGDEILGLNRIQVPADCVNALAIGACDTPGDNWRRASYSSVGPGRSPGLMKPDLVEFGGSMARPFLVVGDRITPSLEPTGGTSFSSPATLRAGIGVRAHFGSSIGLLAIRALLVHRCESSDHPPAEVGWGRLARTLEDIVICDDDTVRVVYQGNVSAAKYIRCPIPMPRGDIDGSAIITATLCYKSLTDPHHPGNYTRAGLEVAFRPHDQRFSRPNQVHPNTKSFFGNVHDGMAEDELRRDATKWENCLHASNRFRGSSLHNPCFDIHYNARLESKYSAPTLPLPYALVVSVQAKKVSDLYDQVVRRYATQLEALRPTVEIPVRM